jgi:hypothetical protein
LLDYLRSKGDDEEKVVLALSQLRERGVADVGSVALKYVRNGSRAVRIEAFRCLATYPGEEQSVALQKGLYDWSPEVRSSVAELIGRYKFYDMIPDLSIEWHFELVPEVKVQITKSLEQLHKGLLELDRRSKESELKASE